MRFKVLAALTLMVLLGSGIASLTLAPSQAQEKKGTPTLIADAKWDLSTQVGFTSSAKITSTSVTEKMELLTVDENNIGTYWDATGSDLAYAVLLESVGMVRGNKARNALAGTTEAGKNLALFDSAGAKLGESSLQGELDYLVFRGESLDLIVEKGKKLTFKSLEAKASLKETQSIELPTVKDFTSSYFYSSADGRIAGLLLGKTSGRWIVIDTENAKLRSNYEFNFISENDVCSDPTLSSIAYRDGKSFKIVHLNFDGSPNETTLSDAHPKSRLWLIHNEAGVLYYEGKGSTLVSDAEEGSFNVMRLFNAVPADTPLTARLAALIPFRSNYYIMTGASLTVISPSNLGDLSKDLGNWTGLSSKGLATFFATPDGKFIFHYQAGQRLSVLKTTDSSVTKVKVTEAGKLVSFIGDGIRLAPWFSEATPNFLVARQDRKEANPYRVFSLEDGKEAMRDYKGKEYPRYNVWLRSSNFLTFLKDSRVLMGSGEICKWDKLKDERKRKVDIERRLDGFLDADHGMGVFFVSKDKTKVARIAAHNASKKLTVRLIDIESGKIDSTKTTDAEYDANKYQLPGQGWVAASASGDLSAFVLLKDNGATLGYLDAVKGKLLWQIENISQDCKPLLTTSGKYVVAVDKGGAMNAYDAKTGKLYAKFDLKFTPLGICEGASDEVFAGGAANVARWQLK